MLPVGILGTEATEARNKDHINFRLNHSRKHNRVSNLEDVSYTIMDTSDMKISSVGLEMRLEQKKGCRFHRTCKIFYVYQKYISMQIKHLVKIVKMISKES